MKILFTKDKLMEKKELLLSYLLKKEKAVFYFISKLKQKEERSISLG